MRQGTVLFHNLLLLMIANPSTVDGKYLQKGIVAEVSAQNITIELEGVSSSSSNIGDVSSLVEQILSTYMADCHLMMAKVRNEDSPIFDSLLRSLKNSYIAEILIELDASTTYHEDLLEDLRQGDDVLFNCRVFLFDLTTNVDPFLALRFLDALELFLIPNTFIIFLGDKSNVEEFLLDHALWNTVNALYLAIPPESNVPRTSLREFVRASIKDEVLQYNDRALPMEADIYSRCLYCNDGEAGIVLVDKWNANSRFLKGAELLFKDQFLNLWGHQFKICSLDWFPIIDFTRDSDEISTTVTPQDSVDVRMLIAIAETLNFTYEMRVPWDNQWGTSTKTENWTGIVGLLQYHKADFSMVLSWTWGRYQVVDFSRIYASEPIVMIMSKPRPLPQYLALIRPLEGTLWLAVFISSVSAGFLFWALQRGWQMISANRALSLDTSILFTWSILFEEPPNRLPKNISSQMFIGWWWLYCTLITVVYKSSLIAHLSVPATSRAIDTFEQLIGADGWTWGYEPSYGSGWEWFKRNQNPTIMKIYEGMEVLEFQEQMDRVLKGQHALITWKYKIKSLIAALYTDNFGYTPIYTAKTEYFNYGGYGWAFRKNSPFLRHMDMVKQRLIETGFVPQWMNDLIGTAAKKARDEKQDSKDENDKQAGQTLREEPTGLVVLSIHHLQSVFYILLLGFFGAFVALAGEILFFTCIRPSSKVKE